ncbi:MAG: peptidoglycan DD-metalloendopeptidase family protein [Candidatus Thiodiazotropha sp.]
MLVGCSTSGSAPVYNRSLSEPPAQAGKTKSTRARPPAYPRSYYLVQPGDTLYSIAWRQNLSYHQLAAWNGIRPPAYQIFPGQRLRLKPPATRHSTQAVGPKAAPRVVQQHRSRPPAPTRPPPVVSKPPKHNGSGKSLKLVWNWPTKGNVVQTFSPGDSNRKGIWIHGRMGQSVNAAEGGKVVYAGNGLVGYGNLIIIKHDRSYLSAYGYNSRLLVREGDRVRKGEVLAQMGAPNVGGQPVLHFEIRRQGKPVNPLSLLPRR